MATKGNRETIRKRNKLIARIFYGAIAILIIWGFIAFITSSPVNEDLMTQRPQGSSTEGSVELPDKPSREKLRFPPFEVMPEGAIAGVLFNAEANFHDVLEKRKLYGILSLLFPSADLEALLAKVDNDLVVCLYESKEQELILKGAITCADEQTAIEQHDKLMELINEDGKLQLGDMALPFQRDGRDISIALIADELPLLPRSTRKPIARLSTAREVQALAGHDEPISVFADLSRLKDFLNRKFPSVNGEASVQTAFNALDLNGVTSAAMIHSVPKPTARTPVSTSRECAARVSSEWSARTTRRSTASASTLPQRFSSPLRLST
ncbi:MAG: hypothetical protein U5N86_12520 [Planctomycetota bacterium]|nr:hypothetical protein [Planctomycetota bacterium]